MAKLDLTAILGNLATEASEPLPEARGRAVKVKDQDISPQSFPLPPQAPDRPCQPHTVLSSIERRRRAELDEVKRARDVLGKYQDSIKAAGRLRSEILAGVRAGEPIEPLFLKACKAISLMTSEPVFYSQIEQDMMSIYGRGQGAAVLLQMEAEQVQIRLDRMQRALEAERQPESRRRIQTAIEAHKDKLRGLLQMQNDY